MLCDEVNKVVTVEGNQRPRVHLDIKVEYTYPQDKQRLVVRMNNPAAARRFPMARLDAENTVKNLSMNLARRSFHSQRLLQQDGLEPTSQNLQLFQQMVRGQRFSRGRGRGRGRCDRRRMRRHLMKSSLFRWPERKCYFF